MGVCFIQKTGQLEIAFLFCSNINSTFTPNVCVQGTPASTWRRSSPRVPCWPSRWGRPYRCSGSTSGQLREKMFQHENKTRLSHCRLNPQFKIDVHNVAVSNKTGSVVYHSGSSSNNQVDKVEVMGDMEEDLNQKILRLACSPTTTYQWNSKKQKYFLSQYFSQKLSTLSILNVHLVH